MTSEADPLHFRHTFVEGEDEDAAYISGQRHFDNTDCSEVVNDYVVEVEG